MDIQWIGVLEECDLCHDTYPMAWIIYTGKQFLCQSCLYPYATGEETKDTTTGTRATTI